MSGLGLAPGTRLGAYEIAERVGAGGMGAVYKAFQPSLGRYVAIKVLPVQTAADPTFRQRFEVEARAVAKLRHPNIVAAFDFAQEGEAAYLVSEFVDGGTLADQIGRPLPLDYAVRVLAPIASALDYAHARGVLHRDVKPTNVLLARDGTPVLTDFGLAKMIGPGSALTRTGALMGTADYIAPEHVAGVEAGPAADQYALALIAYELLVGRHPFAADNPVAAIMAHAQRPVPRPSEFGARLPAHADAALLRALAKRPEERFASATEFVQALSSSHAHVAAPPPPVTDSASRADVPAIVDVPASAHAAASAAVAAAPRAGARRLPWSWSSRRARVVAAGLVLAVIGGAAGVWYFTRTEETYVNTWVAALVSTSAPLSLDRGATGECVIAYRNDGGDAWTVGTDTEIWLKVADDVPQAVRSWPMYLANGSVAAMRTQSVEPGQIAIFSIKITVPASSTESQGTITVGPANLTGQIGDSATCLVNVR